ncbi:MAG TPA: carboxypeptidase-like regulatory domain-containing protein [Pyrinomonadaceae bacterium]|nr:carboxypeptidase regulatory-like domain-containing protein [Chloracidobacterium sp.]HBE81701.1 hypothetical protein [Blastocatellia bacterium]HRJ87512.1 carboxypeptidase-like regulatory domain-containing protein [Pyrinomonadaceae bacterium]HRK50469.1 carboxypeptidase-like regulatory domain-containing protein [Pyrinomonadaceae bacterium]
MKIFVVILFFPVLLQSQMGGPFQIEKSVIAPGGGTAGAGTFELIFTTGQSAGGGPISTPSMLAFSGFWVPEFSPTAAQVSISGRAAMSNGGGLPNITVLLSALDGTTRATRTNSLGYFSFNGVASGQSYIISVRTTRFRFHEPSRLINVVDELNGIDFLSDQD